MSIKQITVMILSVLVSSKLFANEKPYTTVRVLSAAYAAKIATAAEQYCFKKGYQVSVAVTDRYGRLLAFSRNPLAGAHTIGIAKDKAYTSATFQIATINSHEIKFLRGVPRVILVGGGIPIQAGGHMYGAIGVSGAPASKKPGDVDEQCAKAGLNVVKSDLEFAE